MKSPRTGIFLFSQARRPGDQLVVFHLVYQDNAGKEPSKEMREWNLDLYEIADARTAF
jgi:hypothetical protein